MTGIILVKLKGLPLWLSGKESTCSAGDAEDTGLIPGSGRFTGGRNANSSSILAWRTPSLYSLWGHKESDTTGPLSLSLRRTFVPSEPLGSLTRETLLDSHNLTGGKGDPGKEMTCPRSWQLKCRTGSLCCSFGNPSL